MRIAVIVPAHDAAATIGATLGSVLAQSRPPDEIVIVDDGSRDETWAIISSLARRNTTVRALRQDQQGPSAPRNRAIATTDCELVAPLDADDLWDRDYLAALSARFDAMPEAGFAYCRHRLIDGEGRLMRDGMPFALEGNVFGAMLLVNPVGNGSSAVFRRVAIIEAGGYAPPDPAWHGAEDYLLQLRVSARHPVACVPRTLSSYRVHGGSLSRNLEAARKARLAAVAVALREFGPCPLPVERWVAADAARVLAVQSLGQRRWARAAGAALAALRRDPAGTLTDLGRRLCNLAGRAVGRRRATRIDPLVERRAQRLMRSFAEFPALQRPPARDSDRPAPHGAERAGSSRDTLPTDRRADG